MDAPHLVNSQGKAKNLGSPPAVPPAGGHDSPRARPRAGPPDTARPGRQTAGSSSARTGTGRARCI